MKRKKFSIIYSHRNSTQEDSPQIYKKDKEKSKPIFTHRSQSNLNDKRNEYFVKKISESNSNLNVNGGSNLYSKSKSRDNSTLKSMEFISKRLNQMKNPKSFQNLTIESTLENNYLDSNQNNANSKNELRKGAWKNFNSQKSLFFSPFEQQLNSSPIKKGSRDMEILSIDKVSIDTNTLGEFSTNFNDVNQFESINYEELMTPLNRKQDVCNQHESKTFNLQKKFNKYYKISEYFQLININQKKLRVELDNSNTVTKQFKFDNVEYLYNVGSNYVKMFKSVDKFSNKTYSIKIAKLIFSEPDSYPIFLSCVKEALILTSKKHDHENGIILQLESYCFKRKKSFCFWDTEIEMISIYKEHDLNLLDIIRMRKTLKKPYSIKEIESLISQIKHMNDYVENYMGIKIIFINPINIVYSKRTERYYICNLQNVYEAGKDKNHSQNERIQSANNLFKSIFPDLGGLYLQKGIRLDQGGSESSLKIIFIQLCQLMKYNTEKNEENSLSNKTEKENENLKILLGAKLLSDDDIKKHQYQTFSYSSTFIKQFKQSNCDIKFSKNDPKFENLMDFLGNTDTYFVNKFKVNMRNLDDGFKWKYIYFQSNFFETFGSVNEFKEYVMQSYLTLKRYIVKKFGNNNIDNLNRYNERMVLQKLLQIDTQPENDNYASRLLSLINKNEYMLQYAICSKISSSFLLKKWEETKNQLNPKARIISHIFIISELKDYFKQSFKDQPCFDQNFDSFQVNKTCLDISKNSSWMNSNILESGTNLDTESYNFKKGSYENEFESKKNIERKKFELSGINRYILNDLLNGYTKTATLKIKKNLFYLSTDNETQILSTIGKLILVNNFFIVLFSAGIKDYANFLFETWNKKIQYYLSDKEIQIDLLEQCNNLAIFEFLKGKLDKALKILNNGQNIAKSLLCSNHKNLNLILNNLGLIFYLKKNYNKSIDIYEEIFAINQFTLQNHNLGNFKYEDVKSTQYFNYIRVLQATKDYTKAFAYLSTLIHWAERSDFLKEEFKAKCYKLAALLCCEIKDYDSSLYYVKRLLQFYSNKSIDNKKEFLSILKIKAVVLFKAGRKLEAKQVLCYHSKCNH